MLPPPVPEEVEYQLVTQTAQLQDWIKQATAQGFVAIDTETSSLNAAAAELVGVSLALDAGKACYIPLRHRHPSADIESGFDFTSEQTEETLEQIDFDTAITLLKGLCEDPSVLKIGHNIKYDSSCAGS